MTMRIYQIPTWCILGATLVSALSSYRHARAFEPVQAERRSSDPLQVDLGYEVYKGVANASSGLNTWLGIRYAAPTSGKNRWQPPQKPESNRASVIDANAFAPRCPQSVRAPYDGTKCSVPFNSPTLPADCMNSPYFNEYVKGDEDCLFLNVYSPAGAKNLPVYFFIHGGGYGEGDGTEDLSAIINANENGFVGVVIQYRLGAFGFLSSAEVHDRGTPNAGLLDQHFALQWVQTYISLFGGDKSRVTIAGESAGGGSVMLQDMAYGGTQGPTLFSNIIASSPYLPKQYAYSDPVPSIYYNAFAAQVGCASAFPFLIFQSSFASVFDCLQNRDSDILQLASADVSSSASYGTWSFLPVTDGNFVQHLPSVQLNDKQVNGLRALTGNNANEGYLFVPQSISTEDDFVHYLDATFLEFSTGDMSQLLAAYPSTSAPVNPAAVLFSTDGVSGPTALNQSDLGSGQQQRANNVYAETTIVCPSYWLAEAHSGKSGLASYKYQFSVPPAVHAEDLSAFFGPGQTNISPSFKLASMRIWGNFVMYNDPSISNDVANGATGRPSNAASSWPPYSTMSPMQMNLNETGGTPSILSLDSTKTAVPIHVEPGLTNDIQLVNSYTWEGGRGSRCDFWRSLGSAVPER